MAWLIKTKTLYFLWFLEHNQWIVWCGHRMWQHPCLEYDNSIDSNFNHMSWSLYGYSNETYRVIFSCIRSGRFVHSFVEWLLIFLQQTVGKLVINRWNNYFVEFSFTANVTYFSHVIHRILLNSRDPIIRLGVSSLPPNPKKTIKTYPLGLVQSASQSLQPSTRNLQDS